MRQERLHRLLMAATSVAVLIVLVGCGSGSGSSAESSRGEPSNQFPASKGDRHIVEFGSEASVSEREAAGAVLEANLQAREAADFATQCETLDRYAVERISEQKKGAEAKCPSALKKLAEPLAASKEARKDTLGGPIAELRVKGNRGYALFHGTNGNDYAMPMEKEAGEWKVGEPLATEL